MMSETTSAKLFEPFDLGPHRLKNRLAMAPMTRGRAGRDRIPNSIMQTYYVQRSGIGLIISEGTTIDESANGWVDSPGIYTDAMVDGWKKVTDAVHDAGGVIFCQLWHTGRASHSDFRGGRPPVAPSPIAIQMGQAHTPEGKKDYEVPRELATEEIAEIVKMYGRAANRAIDAGFDGVELHGANGYLPDSFTQSHSNQREDRYGGSVENRNRFVEECLDEILCHVAADRVGLRISPNGIFNSMGSWDFREQFLKLAQSVEDRRLVYLHVMNGLGFGFHARGLPMKLSQFREVYSGVIIGNVGYDKDSSIADVQSGDADMIAIGRPLISNPDLASRWRSGQPMEDDADQEVWYGGGAEGYIDFPAFGDSSLNPASAGFRD